MKVAAKVKYNDLSTGLKIAVISAYVVGSLYVLAFLIGFIEGMLLL